MNFPGMFVQNIQDMPLRELLPFVLALLIILVLGLVLYFSLRKQREALQARFNGLFEQLGTLQGCSLDQTQTVIDFCESAGLTPVAEGLLRAYQEGERKYELRWLPKLDSYLNARSCLDAKQHKARRSTAAYWVLGLALLLSLLVLLNLGKMHYLAAFPFLLGLIFCLLLQQARQALAETQDQLFVELNGRLAQALPVFSDQDGTAMLVDQLLARDSLMDQRMNELNDAIKDLAEVQFSEALCNSVEKVMAEEVSPPLTAAANCLNDLAAELEKRQAEGMDALAESFSEALSRQLLKQFEPIHSNLERFNLMMEDTRNFIDDSVAVLENSRQQNLELNRDLHESLRLMTVAKNDLANEMADVSDNLKIISQTTERMTMLYAGEEGSLSEKIQHLSRNLEDALERLNRGLDNSGQAIALAAQLKDDQVQQNQTMVRQLHQISEELASFRQSLEAATTDFTKESSDYVNQTLKNFDQGLAEVVERLIFTASAIRDSVDALPVALRPHKD